MNESQNLLRRAGVAGAALVAGATALLPVFATSILHVGASGFGLLRSATGAGAFVAAVTASRLLPQRRAGHALSREAAHWIAVAMSYDDVIRVAELKSREERFARIRAEVDAGSDDVVGVEEYLHPRLEEIAGLLPQALGRRVLASPRMQRIGQRCARRIENRSVK